MGGLVENPVELSLADLERLGEVEHITMHHCIQGWSGIAKWGGVPMQKLVELVQPKTGSKSGCVLLVRRSALRRPLLRHAEPGERAESRNACWQLTMNGKRLPEVYGAPLRLRVENQLGYKMVKWIERIEFVESEKTLGKGEGGKNEDDEYFDLLPNI